MNLRKLKSLACGLSACLALHYSIVNVAFAAVTLDAVTEAYDQLITETLREIPASRGEQILKGLSQSGSHFSVPADQNQSEVSRVELVLKISLQELEERIRELFSQEEITRLDKQIQVKLLALLQSFQTREEVRIKN